MQGGDVDRTGHVEAHEDEDRAADLAEQPDVVAEHVADEADRRPQRDEHCREAENERDGLAERGPAPDRAVVRLAPGHVPDVRRDERQAAWRSE